MDDHEIMATLIEPERVRLVFGMCAASMFGIWPYCVTPTGQQINKNDLQQAVRYMKSHNIQETRANKFLSYVRYLEGASCHPDYDLQFARYVIPDLGVIEREKFLQFIAQPMEDKAIVHFVIIHNNFHHLTRGPIRTLSVITEFQCGDWTPAVDPQRFHSSSDIYNKYPGHILFDCKGQIIGPGVELEPC